LWPLVAHLLPSQAENECSQGKQQRKQDAEHFDREESMDGQQQVEEERAARNRAVKRGRRPFPGR